MPPLTPIRVLIVDDSLFFRKTLERGLLADPRIQVVGMAGDALEAMDKIRELHPDVVTLDVEMPKLNGIDFLRQLMPTHPVPVIVVSGMPIRVLDALEAGAVEFVRKPSIQSSQDLQAFLADLTAKVRIAAIARVRQGAHVPPRPAADRATSTLPSIQELAQGARAQQLIAIGASTGGTDAILEVVQDLPPTTPGILVVQHMPPVFTKMYAERMDRVCQMEVSEAVHRARIGPGKIIVAAGDSHLRVARDAAGYYIKSEPGPKVSGHCPSVDVLFESVAQVVGSSAIGVLLTGMGADGAKGLLKMKEAGAYTLGQDKDSCVVYGMPQEAYNLGAVARQLPLDAMAREIVRYLNSRR